MVILPLAFPLVDFGFSVSSHCNRLLIIADYCDGNNDVTLSTVINNFIIVVF